MNPTSRGELTPDRRAPITRIAPPDWAAHAVRHVWIVEWDLPPGVALHQAALSYPALNIVAEPSRLAVYGPHDGGLHPDARGTRLGCGRPAQAGGHATVHRPSCQLRELRA